MSEPPQRRYQTRSRTRAQADVPCPPNQPRTAKTPPERSPARDRTTEGVPNKKTGVKRAAAPIPPPAQPKSSQRRFEPSSEPESDQGSSRIAIEFGFEDIHITNEHWASSLYTTLAKPHAITKFLRKRTSGYRKPRGKGQWTQIPQSPADRIELIHPIMDFIERIVAEFSCGTVEDGVTRKVEFTNFSGGDAQATPGPGICVCIRATGPSFETVTPGDFEEIGYINIASIIQVKTEAEISTESDYKQATALVSDLQQIFAVQPNRTFFRTLIVTEKRVRLAHYDRGGMYLTPFINYHSNPTTLILFVLGLTSHDEANLGLDTSVQWTIDPDTGKKVAGTLVALNEHGGTVRYDLNMEKPPFVRPGIVGRGATCWHAVDPDTGKSVVIKDTWRGPDRAYESESESKFLADARGIPGVVQMISHQDNCAATSDFRPSDFKVEGCKNRIKARVVLEECAEPIWNFTSRHQVISALRDTIAVQAHRKLLERGILHRDISPLNILLGHPGAPDGLRGILIDLDMAMRAEGGMSLDEIDPNSGTRTYQSISVLLADDPLNDPIPPHDYLDDLESFLYVLCHILLGFKKPGELVEPTPRLIAVWDDPDARTAMANKVVLMAEGYPVYKFPHIKEYWGNSCKELLEGMRAHISNIVRQKSKIRAAEVSTDERFELWSAFVEKNLESSYDYIDALFRTALAEIAREDAKEAMQIHAESQTSTRADRKRPSEEGPQPTLPRKRTRRRA
ncbi:hypothetical protein D9611_006024 [Ephemerocybe angulata]|uniref:Protein kinase domain-containing protein n=1 Tax=Ephemerocybe angulata TaxID=980116 RepID=A0A8H5CHF3_9AGAR|nr:hypothetical protein D9611_006024 [Tulosesus angulatus]